MNASGDEFAQEGESMQIDSNGDGLNGRKPYDVDVVFILQKGQVFFSSLKLQASVEPDIGDPFMFVNGVNDVKHDVGV